MNTLEIIIQNKRNEVRQKKTLVSIADYERSFNYARSTYSLKKLLEKAHKPQIIAEFKRRSPSLGIINDNVMVDVVTLGYVSAGAAALSILTDKVFFDGNFSDIIEIRDMHQCPILRKDFIIDEYQIVESKALGADVVLLIADVLETKEIKHLSSLAHSLGMEVLLEIHEEKELQKINGHIDIIGVNNRDLKTFHVDIRRSLALAEKIPSTYPKISESGINKVETVKQLFAVGYTGFLMGETFMKAEHPAKACADFIKKIE